jgi:hypothetical protein
MIAKKAWDTLPGGARSLICRIAESSKATSKFENATAIQVQRLLQLAQARKGQGQ